MWNSFIILLQPSNMKNYKLEGKHTLIPMPRTQKLLEKNCLSNDLQVKVRLPDLNLNIINPQHRKPIRNPAKGEGKLGPGR